MWHELVLVAVMAHLVALSRMHCAVSILLITPAHVQGCKLIGRVVVVSTKIAISRDVGV